MSTELVPVTTSLVALSRAGAVAEVIQDNLGGRGMSAFDLQRIKVAAGGAQAFVVTDALAGESTVAKFEALIVAQQRPRAYWPDADPTGEPPACSSPDSIDGDGDNGTGAGRHSCGRCPQNAFGTASRPDGSAGRGKACKESHRLFLLRLDQPQGLFPSLLTCPPASLRGVHQYLTALTGQGVPFWSAVHSVEVAAEKSADGQRYGRVKLGFVRRLTAEEAAAVCDYRDLVGRAVVRGAPPAGDEMRDG